MKSAIRQPNGTMHTLPDDEEQQWLLASLGDLLEHMGAERFLHNPIVEASPRFFPELWRPDLGGAQAIARTLLEHAGLDQLQVSLESFERLGSSAPDVLLGGEEETDGGASATEEPEEVDDAGLRHVAAWFAGIDGDTCRFGIRTNFLRDADDIAGILSHEVAHAYREHHGLVVDDGALEERLTDVTTVFLGFGLLLANIADRTRVKKRGEYISLEKFRGGYLAPESVVFLLAAHAAAQGLGEDAVRRLGRMLDSNQAVCLRHALDELSGDRPGLLECLGLPSTTPHVRTPERSGEQGSAAAPWEDGFIWRGAPWGRVVYRIRDSRWRAGAAAGAAAVIVALMLAPGLFGFGGPSSVAVGIVAGAALGDRIRRDRCSGCQSRMAPDAAECELCASLIIGELRHPPAEFRRGDNRGQPVYRMLGHDERRFLINGGLPAVLLFLPMRPTLGSGTVTALLLASLGALWIAGRMRRRDECSDSDCEAILDPCVRECPKCCGQIDGLVRSAAERLERAHRARHRKSSS